jgi:bacteriocin-like protein
MKNVKTLDANEMQGISGGQVNSCREFQDVVFYLLDNGHNEQAGIILDLYYEQYCGGAYY